METSINNNERELSVLTEKKRNLEDLIRQKMKKVSQDEDTIEECCGKNDIKQYYENMKTKLQEANVTLSIFVHWKYHTYLSLLITLLIFLAGCQRYFICIPVYVWQVR